MMLRRMQKLPCKRLMPAQAQQWSLSLVPKVGWWPVNSKHG